MAYSNCSDCAQVMVCSMILKPKTKETKTDKKLYYPSFFMADQKLRYLGHIIRNVLCDEYNVHTGAANCTHKPICWQANFICVQIVLEQPFLDPTELHSIQPTCGAVIVKQK